MKKIFSALTIMLCMSLSVGAIDVDLVKVDPSSDPLPPESRSEISTLTASIDEQVLTVLFSELTTSQIVVKDSANLTVFNQTYSPAYSAQADLTSLPAGEYVVEIYAFGEWWTGDFEIE